MIKKIITFSLYLLIISSLSLIVVDKASAELICNTESTLGQYTGDTPTKSFSFSFSDPATVVGTFVISAEQLAPTQKYPINHESIYTNNGVPLDLEFKYYDVLYGDAYEIYISKGSESSQSAYSYSNDYVIDKNRPIKILPSTIEFRLKNVFIFNFLAKDDYLRLFTKYFTGSLDAPNRIKATAGMDLNPSIRDLGDIDIETLKNSINIDMFIEIPLKLAKTDYYSPNGYLSNSAMHAGNKIISETVARIKVDPNGITFEPFFNQNLEEKNKIEPVTPEPIKENKGPIYTGHGLNQLKTDVYQGISNERDLKAYIVGITNFILSFVVVIAVMMLIYGGYLWIVDQGDDTLIEKSKKIIAGSVMGILIIISAYTIINTVITLEGNDMCNTNIGLLDGSVDVNCLKEGSGAITSGIGSVVGNVLGGNEGTLLGGIIGGLF